MSSQRLLWETIRDGLLDDPLAMGDNPEQFLRTKAKRHGIDLSSIDVANWLIALVVPAWQAGLARQLVADGIRIQIHGSGWSQIEQVDGSVCGPIIERSEWVEAVRASVGLVHLWPTWPGHPVIHSGKPLLVPWRMTRSAWLNAAKALVSKGQTMQPGVDVGCDAMLSAPLLRELAGV